MKFFTSAVLSKERRLGYFVIKYWELPEIYSNQVKTNQKYVLIIKYLVIVKCNF